MTVLRFLVAGYADPDVVRRLGRARLTRFLMRHSRGMCGDERAGELLAVAAETAALWDDGLDHTALAEDIALEARMALTLSTEIKELNERIRVLVDEADPSGIVRSAPGVGPITGAAILGRLGDPARFSSLAGVRAFSGLVPRLDASGLSGQHGGPTKRGDAVLREALYMAADHARRLDPTLAARYHRLMTESDKHYVSALCHIAPTLLTRIVACWRRGEPYVLRDVDGRAVDAVEARAIIAARYTVPATVRDRGRTTGGSRTGRRDQRSRRASSPGPSTRHAITAVTA
jgi:transposase